MYNLQESKQMFGEYNWQLYKIYSFQKISLLKYHVLINHNEKVTKANVL